MYIYDNTVTKYTKKKHEENVESPGWKLDRDNGWKIIWEPSFSIVKMKVLRLGVWLQLGISQGTKGMFVFVVIWSDSLLNSAIWEPRRRGCQHLDPPSVPTLTRSQRLTPGRMARCWEVCAMGLMVATQWKPGPHTHAPFLLHFQVQRGRAEFSLYKYQQWQIMA